MEFGIMFFSSAASVAADRKYGLLIDAAQFADRHGFRCIWTPERHFHEFGGLFPTPSITSAALAMVTERLQIRAGSLISPLHDTIRIAEEWSVVDNLSGGRVAISFGSGWNADDFVFFPERYATRRDLMFDQVAELRRIWAGGSVRARNGAGRDVEISILPRPVQREMPIWITSSGNAKTFTQAGEIGANVLTHLIDQNLEVLATKIHAYRAARRENGFVPEEGVVSLLLHTFLGADREDVRRKVREPFREYLRSAVSLERMAATAGGVISGGHKIDPHNISPAAMEELLDLTFERYFESAALMGTPESCRDFVWRLKRIGVDEIACLIDFGLDSRSVLEGLAYLDELRAAFSEQEVRRQAELAVSAFLADPEE